MILFLLSLLASVVPVFSSTVSVLSPLDAQLPLIARVDKPFSWSFSSSTFESSNGLLNYAASSLPDWLSFDVPTLTFHGTPSAKDEGNPEITITASDSTSSASSDFTLCVTPYPPPTLNLPISTQFYPTNPSLSSVFVLASGSAIATANPALRIPPRWSFSIGFQGDTFKSSNHLYYYAMQANGSSLPEWMVFSSKTITVNGVVPDEHSISSPQTLSLALHASDQEGYTASSLPFDLVLALHELSLSTPSLPTINVTALTPFNVSLSSPADFSGVLVDGKAIQLCDILNLAIDTSQYGGWLKYDNRSMMLTGDPPGDVYSSGQGPPLPVVLTTTFNQSIETNVSLAFVPSYFSSPNLPPILGTEDGQVHFSLVRYFSNATAAEQRKEVNLTVVFDPSEASYFLNFDPGAAQLTGMIPANFSSTHVTVTFTAYSHITHSTSHTSLSISASPSNYKKSGFGSHPTNLSTAARHRLVLGLGIAFAIIGSFCFLGGILSAIRHYARLQDTALGGEEGRSAWSEQDKKWYGIGAENGETGVGRRGPGYGWTEHSPGVSEKSRHAMDIQNPFEPSTPVPGGPDYGDLGLGLQRVSGRSHLGPGSHPRSPARKIQSPGVMSKREFITRIKETVRNVSDKYSRGLRGARKRPVIGKPILSKPMLVDDLPFNRGDVSVSGSPSNPFDDLDLRSYPGSTIMTNLTNSPSSSTGETGERSIPRRRADFAPPRSPALVHFEDGQHSRKLSAGSTVSLGSNSSSRTHAAEAVVQIASRATSVRSGRSASGMSHQSLLPESPQVAGTRPRLVPFTSATRVPVPRLSSPPLPERSDGDTRSLVVGKRVASQSARVWKNVSKEDQAMSDVKSGSEDELSMGLHYVSTLGADEHTVGTNPSITVSTNLGSSVSSSESSHQGGGVPTDVMRMLVRTGEKFKFRVPVQPSTTTLSKSIRKLEARLISGGPLPKFLLVDLDGNKKKGTVEFYGAPAAGDLGKLDVGVYSCDDGACIARVEVEVVGRS